MQGRRGALVVLAAMALVAAGCTATAADRSIAPNTEGSATWAAAIDPTTNPATPGLPGPSEHWTAAATSDRQEPSGAVPSCGYAVPALTEDGPTRTPPPDTCHFTGSSPGCPSPVSVVVEGTSTRTLARPTEVRLRSIGGFGRWGGRTGGPMCFAEFPDRSIQMSNDDQVTLIRHNEQFIVYAHLIELARSPGVWGVVTAQTATVRVQDSTRSDGIAATLYSLSIGGGTAERPPGVRADQVFIAPVSSGPVTVTAYDASGSPLASSRLG